ncbi:hypothetical protein BJV77DRAFT_633989 [Russula vinacea]|nr:hypothetical protein BJV77DRAFT_633989 [Russula vinacea]
MVNYKDPATIAKDAEAVVKLWHLMDGVFIWEFLTTLDYEWDVIRGHRPYRWTIWVYSIARVATLLDIVVNLIGLNITTEINCQAWSTFIGLFAYIAYMASSMLIVLRIIAIWNKAKIIFAIAMGIWVADNGIFIYGLSLLRSKWSPEALTCVLFNVSSTKPAIIGSLFSDIVLLLIMLIGLLRMRHEARKGDGLGSFPLVRTLWKQGLIWLLVATVAEVPSAVLMILDLNVPLNLVTQEGLFLVTIAATRLYRSLINIYSSDISQDSPRRNGREVSELRVRPGPIPPRIALKQVDMSMSRAGMYINTDPEGSFRRHEVSLNDDVESSVEK